MVPEVAEESSANVIVGRDAQIDILETLLEPSFPTPSIVVIYGLEATGKTLVTSSLLQSLNVLHASVDVRLCINGRQLLEDVYASICEASNQKNGQEISITTDLVKLPRNDSLNALQANLEALLKTVKQKIVLVLDAIDRQRDAPSTLLPALARIGEYIPNLTVICILSIPSPRLFHTVGIPHVHFPAYSREEVLAILSHFGHPGIPAKLTSNDVSDSSLSQEDADWIWPQFCTVMWDSIGKGAARDLVSFREACHQLWRPFVQPAIDGNIRSRDFAKLIVKARPLLQGEDALLDDYSIQTKDKSGGLSRTIPKAIQDLPYYTKHILIAAYLASYNPSRLDTLYFMKSTEKKRRRKQNAVGSKTRKIPRNLLAPAPFSLDRLLAITCALLPQPMPRTAGTLNDIATLVSLKLVLRSGGGSTDPLDPSAKFRVNVGWDFIVQCGRSVNLDVRDYAAWTAG